MIQETYCSFEQAKILRELGFPQWSDNPEEYHPYVEGYDIEGNDTNIFSSNRKLEYSKVPLSLVQKWLREEHFMCICVEPKSTDQEHFTSYWYSLWCGDNFEDLTGDYPTYEDALSAGINKCIEYIKGNNIPEMGSEFDPNQAKETVNHMSETFENLLKRLNSMTEEEREQEFESITHRKFYNRWVEKVHQLGEEKRASLIKKVIQKYASQEYKNKEYKLGYEPREELFWLLHEYALKYGKFILSEGDGYFPTEHYLVDNKWYIKVIYGQGSIINVKEYVEKD